MDYQATISSYLMLLPGAESNSFDLREAYSWGTLRLVRLYFGGFRWVLVGVGVAVACLGVAHIILSAIVLPPPLWTRDNVVDLGATPIGLLFAYAIATGLRNRVAVDLRLIQDGIVVTFLDQSKKELRWDDPTLHAGLVQRSGDPAFKGHVMFALSPVGWSIPAILTETAYSAAINRVRAQGLVLREFTRDQPPLHLEMTEFGSSGTRLDPLPAGARVR